MSFLSRFFPADSEKEKRPSSVDWFNKNRANLQSSVQAHLHYWTPGVEDPNATLVVQTTFIYAIANLHSLEEIKKHSSRPEDARGKETGCLIAACAQTAVFRHLEIASDAPNLQLPPTPDDWPGLDDLDPQPATTKAEPQSSTTKLTDLVLVELGYASRDNLAEFLVAIEKRVFEGVLKKTQNEFLAEGTAELFMRQLENRLIKLKQEVGPSVSAIARAFARTRNGDDPIDLRIKWAIKYRWRDVWKKAKKTIDLAEAELHVSDEPTPSARTEVAEGSDWSRRVVLGLDTPLREAVIAHVIDQFKTPQTAEKCFHLYGEFDAPDTILKRLNRAKEIIAENLRR